ncbi:conserved hypothetical protein [Neospora caninum Liverpool]|uniref:Poly(A) RNA polymerase mitochondrial-like central palm domain-containing protein n=1 Tax=Neospora caninum (strain Liverpool) TaxID=572307 RepID=F0VH62_NEOCL|nr:conserved hypothetical protein [Neospora caninum Liverpool]CBZ53056.1 conserved hypothetical protein [Neospora caninum Liverpool]|eukprot:XP_003883088.1 conserved hypothetical protein [Neospora caninum Liverpool]
MEASSDERLKKREFQPGIGLAPPSASRLPVPLTQGASPGRLPLPGRSLRRRAVAPVHASGSTASILSAPRPRSRSMVEGFKQLISSRPATLSFSSHRSFAAVASSRADAPPCRVPTAAPAALGPSSAVLSCGRPAASASLGLVASANTSPFSSGHSRSSPTGSRHASSLPSIAAARDLAVCRESTGSEEYKAQLGAQLLEIDQRMLPDADQFLQKQYLLDTLGPLLRQHIGGQLVPFGSCANGFWVRGSDVDSCLVLSGCEGRIAQRAKLRVVRELVERHRIGQATVVPAQVPIAKVCNAHGKGLIDVSVNNCTALENSMFVETFGAIDDRVRPLGRFIKHWAKQRNINNRAILLGRAPAKAAASAAPSSCFLAVSSPSSPSAGSHQADGNPASEEDFADCKRKEEDARQDVAAGGQSAMAPRTPAEGLKPLPFCTDIDYIRTNLFPEYGRNKETVGELIHDFFLFYGKRSSKLFSPRDGATVTVEVYDGSISVCPPPPGSSSSSSALGSPPPESSSCHSGPRDASSLAASAALSHVTAETLKAIALADPLGATPQSSTAVPSASSQGEAEESESKRQAGMCSVNESGEFASPLSMARRVLMRCPLTRAVVNRFSAAAWKIICDEFQRAEELVENGATLEEICAPAPVTHDQRKKLGLPFSYESFVHPTEVRRATV